MAVVRMGYELTPEQIREKVTICTVDDFQTMTSILRNTLSKIGFNKSNITGISGPKASLEMNDALQTYTTYEEELSWQIPKVLFIDWNMPQMTGLDLLKKLRSFEDKRVKNIIVIMVTAESIKENVVSAIQAGVDNYITKPITQKTVEKKLREVSGNMIRKAETMIAKTPNDIHTIIHTIDLAIALDAANTKSQRIKAEYLGTQKQLVTAIIEKKVETGKLLVTEGKYNKAAGDFGGAIGLKPSDILAQMEYGKMMMKKTLYDKAVESFEFALRFYPDTPEAHGKISEPELLELLGEAQFRHALTLDSSDELMNTAVSMLQKSGSLYRSDNNLPGLARTLGKTGEVYMGRAGLAERMISRETDQETAYKLKGLVSLYYDKATVEYNECLKLNKDDMDALVKLSNIFAKTGKANEAAGVLEKTQQMQSESPKTTLELAKTFLQKGDKSTALFHMNKIKDAISIEDIELYEEIILVLLEYDMPDEAISFIETVAGERPDLFNNLGLAYRALKNHADAIKAYDKAIKFDITGDRVRYLFNRGVAHRQAGNYALAIQDNLEAFKTNNVFKHAADQLGNLSDGLVLLAKQAFNKKEDDLGLLNLKLSFIANQNSQQAQEGLTKLGVTPSSLLNAVELTKLGFNDPAVVTEHYE